jgi:hypothetical protein
LNRSHRIALANLVGFALLCTGASAQRANDFVVTGGISWETYKGNFSVVNITTVDSTKNAAAAIAEIGARGNFGYILRPNARLDVDLDGGLRQFAATGFQLRDYAPREWVSQLNATYSQAFTGVGLLMLHGAYRGRRVEDRPPMPLFLQPGYTGFRGTGSFRLAPIQNVALDAQVDLEHTNYEAPRGLSHIDFLDRTSKGFEVGASTSGTADWSIRFFSGFRSSHYLHQATQVTDDPFRRDKTVNLGALWRLEDLEGESPVREASLGVEGTVNRSNSLRPQYDALSVSGDFSVDLPWWGLSTGLTSLLTWKTYVHQTTFARLVPGEEADNASVVHLDFTRNMASNLSGMLRFGWTRAETDIGNSYYSRFGTSLLFNFRPAGQ